MTKIAKWLKRNKIQYTTTIKGQVVGVKQNWEPALIDYRDKVQTKLNLMERVLASFVYCVLQEPPLPITKEMLNNFDEKDQTLLNAQKMVLTALKTGDDALLDCIATEISQTRNPSQYYFVLERIRHIILYDVAINPTLESHDSISVVSYNPNSEVVHSAASTDNVSVHTSASVESSASDLPVRPFLPAVEPAKIVIKIDNIQIKTITNKTVNDYSDYQGWSLLTNFKQYVMKGIMDWFSWSNHFFINHFADNSQNKKAFSHQKQAVKDAYHTYQGTTQRLTQALQVFDPENKNQLVENIKNIFTIYKEVQNHQTDVKTKIEISIDENIYIEYYNSRLLAFYEDINTALDTHQTHLDVDVEQKMLHLMYTHPCLDWREVLTLLSADKSEKVRKNVEYFTKVLNGEVFTDFPVDLTEPEKQRLIKGLEGIALVPADPDSEVEQEKRAYALIALAKNQAIYADFAQTASNLPDVDRIKFLKTVIDASNSIIARAIAKNMAQYKKEQEPMLDSLLLLAANIQDGQRDIMLEPIIAAKIRMSKKFEKIPLYLDTMKRRIQELNRKADMPNIIALAIELFIADKYGQAKEFPSFAALKEAHGAKSWWNAFESIYKHLEIALNKKDKPDIAEVIQYIDRFYDNEKVENLTVKLAVYRSLKGALKILKDDYPDTALIYHQKIQDKIKQLEHEVERAAKGGVFYMLESLANKVGNFLGSTPVATSSIQYKF